MSTLKQLGKVCCVSCCLFFGVTVVAQETPVSADAWVQQLVDCVEHMPAAFGVGPKITHLDPDIGLEIAQTAWPKLANKMVKTGVLKTFAFSKGLPETHPHIIQVLHLGMTDDNEYVRNYAASYLSSYALQDFSDDAEGYQQWFAQYGAMSLQELRTATRYKLQGRLQDLVDALSESDTGQVYTIAMQLGNYGDPSVIPYFIGMIEADNTEDSVYGIGWFSLNPLTNVEDGDDHDGKWWREWWEEHKTEYPLEVQLVDIPDYPKLAEQGKAKRIIQKQKLVEVPSDIAEVPSKKLLATGDANSTYFLIRPKIGENPPKAGYKLVVVLPGGDGSEDFHPFVKRIYKYAVPENYIVVQPVAPKWTDDQVIVWPHASNKVSGMKFTTEEFIENVIADVKKRFVVDPRHVFTLSWSSSGPAAYAASLQESKSITGSYVSMSVFKPDYLPGLTNAKDHVYYIEHSPDDNVCPFEMAEQARDELTAAKAKVKFSTYEGGHGWRGNIYKRIRNGIEWLESNTNSNLEIVTAQN